MQSDSYYCSAVQMFPAYTVLSITEIKNCVWGGGGGVKGERVCISKQQNLNRAMRDWDLMHE